MQDTIPIQSVLNGDLPRYGYRDSVVVDLGPGRFGIDPVIVAFTRSGPWWFHGLLALRNALVRPLGLKTGAATASDVRPPFRVGQAIGVFRILALTGDEVVFGEDDRHLDFRVSLLLLRGAEGDRLAVSSLVRINNGLGTGYFAVVKPFHRFIVPIMARNMATVLRRCGPQG